MTPWPNWVDLLVVTFFIRGCYIGLSRGLLAELLHAVGLVSATALTCNYFGQVSQLVMPWMGWFGPDITDLFVFLFLLLGLGFCVRVVVARFGEVVKWEHFHWFFQGLGLALGAVRGIWWAGIFVVLLASSKVEYLQSSVTKESVVGPGVERIARPALTFAADWFPGAMGRTALVPQIGMPPGRTTK